MAMGLYGFGFRGLGGRNEIQLYAETEAAACAQASALVSRVNEIERKYSRFRPESKVSEVNRNAGCEAVKIDGEMASMIDHAAAAYQKSGGLFDITSGVLRRVWDFKSKRIPSPAELAAVVPLVDWSAVEWSRPYLRLPRTGMEIDLGGIGKEFAVDLLAELAAERGVQHALINLGGDIRVVGPHPDGRPWRIGIRHPRNPRKILSYAVVNSGAIATSGDYERFFEHDGRRYCHILDPRTGMPVTGCQAATVAAPTCLEAGTLTTTAMLLGAAPACELLRREGRPHLVVDATGGVRRFGPRAWSEAGAMRISAGSVRFPREESHEAL